MPRSIAQIEKAIRENGYALHYWREQIPLLAGCTDRHNAKRHSRALAHVRHREKERARLESELHREKNNPRRGAFDARY